MEVEFSLDGYRKFISELSDSNIFVSFSNFLSNRGNVLMRHDVDFDPLPALEIAKLEKELGVTSVFCFLVNSSFYNFANRRTLAAVNEIADLGHDIGIHFDVGHEASNDELSERCGESIKVFRAISGIQPICGSFHRPKREVLGLKMHFGGIPNLYHYEYFTQLFYVSDSGGLFKYGNPYQLPALRGGNRTQLLTHPFWWVNGRGSGTPAETVRAYIGGAEARLRESFLQETALEF